MICNEEECVKLFNEGDILYRVSEKGINKITIIRVESLPHYVYKDNLKHTYFNRNIKNTCFKTYEEAEKELQRRQNIKEKRKLLKEYETQLNEKFNIINHYIVK